MLDIVGKRVVSIIGNVKNAGKTTVLNQILSTYQNPYILTSIGLDGEALDQVTHLEKPDVFVRKGDIIITAANTLKQFTATINIVKQYDINTPLGYIVLCEVLAPGIALIAGPSKVSEMHSVIQDSLNIYPYQAIIDGAFFRQSFAQVSDGTIFVIGSNYSRDMDKTIENAVNNYWKLTRPLSRNVHINELKDEVSIIRDNQIIRLGFKSLLGHQVDVLNQLIDDDILFSPKALTDQFVSLWTQHYKDKHFSLILNHPTDLQLSDIGIKRLKELSKQVTVLHPMNILEVCINPYSPSGYIYNSKDFKLKLTDFLNRDIVNVKEADSDE